MNDLYMKVWGTLFLGGFVLALFFGILFVLIGSEILLTVTFVFVGITLVGFGLSVVGLIYEIWKD